MDEVKRRTRSFILTWNNYPECWKDKFTELFETSKVKYIVGGKEIAPTTGTPHIQGHIDFIHAKTITSVQKIFKKFQIQIGVKATMNDEHACNNREYCLKDGDYQEWGKRPQPGARNDLVAFMDDVRENPKKRKIERVYEFAPLYAKYPRFCNEYKLLLAKPEILQWTEPPNIWVYGAPGSGKSRPYQEATPAPFIKAPNKWWDGYDEEPVVLIEDLEPQHSRLSWYIKIWADRYPFSAEVKGYTIRIRPKQLVITSNFHPSGIFEGKILEAIVRRFQIIKR